MAIGQRKTGEYQILGDTTYFIPYRQPPTNPALIIDEKISFLYGEAMLHLGRLSEMTKKLPDTDRFIKAYITKEALLSSSIEGIQTTLLDVFTQPLLTSRPNKETQLVLNYTKALSRSLDMIKKEGLPIANRVILAAHKELMSMGDGDSANPGHFRSLGVRVGSLVPPPPQEVSKLMAELEKFINDNDTLPPLIKAGLAHVQFETIHPFLDGNGRIGRLLIVLMLVESNILSNAALYPSYYFKKHHLDYYRYLDRVRTDGDFEVWILFYLQAIRDSSIDAYKRAVDIQKLIEELSEKIMQDKQFDSNRESRLKALSILFSFPVISINELSTQLDMSYNTANKIITNFVDLGFLSEETQQKRGKLYRLMPYFEVLQREYDI